MTCELHKVIPKEKSGCIEKVEGRSLTIASVYDFVDIQNSRFEYSLLPSHNKWKRAGQDYCAGNGTMKHW